MPTLIKLDSFQHQVLRVANATAADDWYRLVTDTGTSAPSHGGGNITFDTGIVRTAEHAVSLKLAFLAARGIQVRYGLAAGNRNMNVSFYFRSLDATNPGSQTTLFVFGATENGVIGIDTSGRITAKHGAGTLQNGSVDVCDGAWHRIDAKCDTSTTTGTLDVQVDGTALTQATDAITAADITDLNFGLATANVDYTVYVSDFVASATSGDYPMGDHICKKLEINGKGTHSLGSGAFQDEAGSTTDDFEVSVDDAWDGTTPDLDQTGEDFVQQTANDGAAYVEFTLADPSESTIWGAQLGTLVAAEDSTTACNCETRLVDSGGATRATTGLIDPSVSSTVYNGYRIIASAPGGGWDGTALSGCKVRFGFSTDAAPDVLLNSAIAEYAAPWSASGDATATPATVAAVAAVPAPTVLAGAIAAPGTVAAPAAVPAPTVRGDAVATPATVGVVAAVPAPTIIATSPDVVVTPATVAVVAAVPAPTVRGDARSTPAAVAAVASVPAPVVQASARPTPASVAAVASVPAPTVKGAARPTPATVAAIAAVPGPTLRSDLIVAPATVAAVAAVPAPTVAASATASPATVAVVAQVPAPTIFTFEAPIIAGLARAWSAAVDLAHALTDRVTGRARARSVDRPLHAAKASHARRTL
jgi:hypothetical protein